MDAQSIETLLTTGAGVGGGALSVGSVAWYFIKRYLKENDNKHRLTAEAMTKLAESQRSAYRALNEKLAKINTHLAVIESRMGEVMNVRGDVKENSRAIAVSVKAIEHAEKDIDKGFASCRHQLQRFDEELSKLKNLKAVGG